MAISSSPQWPQLFLENELLLVAVRVGEVFSGNGNPNEPLYLVTGPERPLGAHKRHCYPTIRFSFGQIPWPLLHRLTRRRGSRPYFTRWENPRLSQGIP